MWLNSLLEGYNESIRYYLVSGFTSGFSIGCTDLTPGDVYDNLPSCQEAPCIIDEYIEKEKSAGRLVGPFPPQSSAIKRISPIGLIPKKAAGTYRVIHHLSYPAGSSVNDHISRTNKAVQYGSIDDAVEQLAELDAPFLAKRTSSMLFA